MSRTRQFLSPCSAVLVTAVCIAVSLSHHQHAAAVKIDRAGSCWTILDSTVLDATSDTTTSSGQPAYQIINNEAGIYIVGNETIIRNYFGFSSLGLARKEYKLETMEPEGLTVSCAADSNFNTELDCWNFIRIVELTSTNDLLVCGTNAISKICYKCDALLDDCSSLIANYTELNVIPERHNTNAPTALFDSTSVGMDMLYGGAKALKTFNRYSVKADLSGDNPIKLELDTVTTGDTFLKDPTFIGRPFEYSHNDDNEYVFVVYRETALEFTAGDRVYSRIARVCKNDTGGAVDTTKFVTFIKARLECSIPIGDEPAFEYDYIQDVVWDDIDEEMHAIFTNQENGPATSALCRYRMQDIMNLFDNGNFQEQTGTSVTAQWTEISVDPVPRPGKCDAVHMTSYPPLLFKSVPNYNANERTGGVPSGTPSSLPNSDPPILYVDGVRFTSLAVDLKRNVSFVGTSAGSVIKFTQETCGDCGDCVDWKGVELVFDSNEPINGLDILVNESLDILVNESLPYFLLGTSDTQSSIQWPLVTKCQSASNEEQCGWRSPYCVYTNDTCNSSYMGIIQDPPTVLSEDVLTVLPNASVSACQNEHVYWFCTIDNSNPIVNSSGFNLTWNATKSDEVTITYILPELVKLDVIVQTETVGSYSCTADVGGRILTKQVEITSRVSCVTVNSLQAQCDEYTTLKAQNEALKRAYGNNDTCSVKRQGQCSTCP